MGTICFLPLHASSWKEMLPLAQALQTQALAKPVVLACGDLTAQVTGDCQALGLEAVALETTSQEPRGLSGLAHRLREKAELSWKGPGGGPLPGLVRAHRRLLADQYREVGRVLDRLRPQAVAVMDGRKYGWQLPLMRACRERGIPTAVPPVALTVSRLELAQRNQGQRFLAEAHPALLRHHPGQAHFDPQRRAHVFFYPVEIVSALAAQDMLPPDPWVLGGGCETVVMVEGQEEKEKHLASGLAPSRLAVTGHRAHDSLFARLGHKDDLRRELCARYALSASQPLVLLTLPSFAEQGHWGWDEQWREVEHLCRVTTQQGGRPLVSLHPKMERGRYLYLEEKFGLALARERLEEILPAADIFLASFSSTVPWAVLCRVPTLIYAFHGFTYSMFDHLGGVRVHIDRQEFSQALGRLTRDGEWRGLLAREAEGSARRLSPFDGHCQERILRVLLGREPARQEGPRTESVL